MKTTLYAIAALLVLAACGGSSDGYKLEGTLTGELENGTQVFLKKTDERNQPVDVDTATVENGVFSFAGAATGPELHYIFINKIRGNIPVILENGTIEVSAQKDSLAYAKISGTPQNKLFASFLKESRAMSARANSMYNDMRTATTQNDTVQMNSLRDEYFELQEEAKKFEMDFARENPDALISLMILDKVYTTKAIGDEEAKVLFDALAPELKETSVGKKLKEKLDKGKSTSIGATAPNFTGPSPTGEELALHDVLGKVTILDFWAAWCKPCRVENPNVVRIYNKYHDKGLNILGVSLDRKAEDWKKAIEDDGLAWNHVSNVNYFDEIAQLYNVNAIPATFILDEKGVIIAKDLRGAALEEKIAELLQ